MARETRNAQVTEERDWRCPNMRQHMVTTDRLLVPCRECYTVEVIHTEIRVPLDLRTIEKHRSWVTWTSLAEDLLQ